MIIRSEKVPESPSSALHTIYFCDDWVSKTVCHLIPVGKAAPPLPRSPESLTSSTIFCGSKLTAFFKPTKPS